MLAKPDEYFCSFLQSGKVTGMCETADSPLFVLRVVVVKFDDPYVQKDAVPMPQGSHYESK